VTAGPAGAEFLWLRSRTFPECARSLLGPRTPAPDGPRGPRGDPDCGHANSRAGRGSTGPIPCGATSSASLQVAPATMGSKPRRGFLPPSSRGWCPRDQESSPDPDEILARAVWGRRRPG